MTETIAKLKDAPGQRAPRSVTYWRVEGSLLEGGAMRLVGFFTWNAQRFSERWARRLAMAARAGSRPPAPKAVPDPDTSVPDTFLHWGCDHPLGLPAAQLFQMLL